MSKFNLDPKIQQELKKFSKQSEKAIKIIEEVTDDFINSTFRFDLADSFIENLISSLKHSPNPEQSLNNFTRFIENTFNKTSIYKDLAIYPQMMKILITTFGYSQYFADILVRDPELFRWLTYTDILDRKMTKENYTSEIRNAISPFKSTVKKLNTLRRYKRHEILRIGVRDIFNIADFNETVNSISDLAEAIVEVCLELAIEEIKKKFSAFPETEYVIIALGKLGGKELNYSSDIDLIFVYNQEGEIKTSKGVVSHYEIFNDLVSTLINFLSEKTEEGNLYRVDFRLRPEGSVGSLARSLLGYLTYYEVYGKIWERQMLIKARPIAGNLNFGYEFIKILDSFVYPKSFYENPIEEIAKIKSKIESTATSELNIKLRKGGIRDIEFIVQTLQLLNGGRNPDLKEPNTLKAIEKLATAGFLTQNEAKILSENYIYFRRIEHLLQISQNLQVHTIPSDPNFLTSLAKAMRNYEREKHKLSFPEQIIPDWKIFKRELEDRFESVRKIFDKIFNVQTKPAFLITEIFGEEIDRTKIYKTLDDLNFKDKEKALRNIQFLSKGRLITGEEIFSPIEENSFLKIAPILLGEISKTLIPDITLDNFRKIAEGFRYSKSFYEFIQNDSVRKIILNLSQYSPRFSNLLSLKTYLLETLVSENNLSKHKKTKEILQTLKQTENFKLHDFKFLNELKFLILNLDNLLDIDELAMELTHLADLIFNEIFSKIFDESEKEKIVIIGLGKFGSEEMSFDSDLDIVMITDEINFGRYENLILKCEAMLKILTEIEIEKLYNVDIRLRPEGRNAPILAEINYIKSYFKNRAELWEIQAFTRARVINGNPKIWENVKEVLFQKILKLKFNELTAKYLQEMRSKMEKNVKTGEIDIKLSAGGLTDIEFVAQILQMKNFNKTRKIERNTLKALDFLLRNDFINETEYEILISNYRFYREVEKFLRVSIGTRSNLIPSDSDKLEYLSLCLGYRFVDEFVDSIKKRMRKTRQIFNDLLDKITHR